VGVDVECGGALGMSEPAGGGADVDAAGEHGRGGEVAEVVEPQAVEAVTPGEAAEGERDVVRTPWVEAVGSMGEDERVGREVGRRRRRGARARRLGTR
jgi:hypothetical protein